MRTELLKMPNFGPNASVWAGWLGHLKDKAEEEENEHEEDVQK